MPKANKGKSNLSSYAAADLRGVAAMLSELARKIDGLAASVEGSPYKGKITIQGGTTFTEDVNVEVTKWLGKVATEFETLKAAGFKQRTRGQFKTIIPPGEQKPPKKPVSEVPKNIRKRPSATS